MGKFLQMGKFINGADPRPRALGPPPPPKSLVMAMVIAWSWPGQSLATALSGLAMS